jgi:AP-4 complex subunit mu-1
LICESLNRISILFKDYTGDLTEESLRKNFILVYELLDEIFDYGFHFCCFLNFRNLQNTSSRELKYFTFNEPIESLFLKKLKAFSH